MSECTNYGGIDLTAHKVLQDAFQVAVLIEACGASEDLTKASSAAFDLLKPLSLLVAELRAEQLLRKGLATLLDGTDSNAGGSTK